MTYLDEFIDLKQNKQYIACLTMKILCDIYIVSSFLGIVQYLDAYLKNAQKMEASFLPRCLHLHIKVDEVDDFVILFVYMISVKRISWIVHFRRLGVSYDLYQLIWYMYKIAFVLFQHEFYSYNSTYRKKYIPFKSHIAGCHDIWNHNKRDHSHTAKNYSDVVNLV